MLKQYSKITVLWSLVLLLTKIHATDIKVYLPEVLDSPISTQMSEIPKSIEQDIFDNILGNFEQQVSMELPKNLDTITQAQDIGYTSLPKLVTSYLPNQMNVTSTPIGPEGMLNLMMGNFGKQASLEF